MPEDQKLPSSENQKAEYLRSHLSKQNQAYTSERYHIGGLR